ncbi:ATP-binding cassette domain-containing protein [Sphingomonas donggukensis]|uniref:ATP-binding cassette domain-containing protein n=1 Tax=Sphingomonas donggukensis TaxID=2949093 RepID=A0ABY4TQP9_9SPHN|nr:ATP-binding cassette domain-containing protein [Sphingomonas donggukensis]URW74557.1 ATP-binding cassette domain-containing protein [Sphingomonas donggukensis]
MRFDVDVAARVGEAEVACAFAADDGLTVLFGPSGAGKTSVLNMIAGLLPPARGHVRVGERTLFDAAAGVDVPPAARRIGYVFQDSRLFPHKRVRANLLYGAASDARLAETVAFLGIAHLLDRWPKTLSGGEARRVAIGRALLSDPDILLLDEPLSSLDASRRAEIEGVILTLRDTARLPIVLVTHDAGEAERLGTQVVAMG